MEMYNVSYFEETLNTEELIKLEKSRINHIKIIFIHLLKFYSYKTVIY